MLPAGIINTMSYEPGGLRVKLEESTGVKQFVWEATETADRSGRMQDEGGSSSYLQQTDATGSVNTEYTTEPTTYGPLISHRQSSATTTYHYDALGSTRALTDASESILQAYNYSAWGTLLGTPTLLTPFLWVGSLGYHWDQELQNQYIRARYYRPTIARWWSAPKSWSIVMRVGVR